MTTPPLDLPALRELAASQGNHWGLSVSLSAAKLKAMIDTVEYEREATNGFCADRNLWRDRAEAAEAKVAAVRARHRPVSVMEAWGTHGRDLDGAMACAVCTSPDDASVTLHPCPELTALDGTP